MDAVKEYTSKPIEKAGAAQRLGEERTDAVDNALKEKQAYDVPSQNSGSGRKERCVNARSGPRFLSNHSEPQSEAIRS